MAQSPSTPPTPRTRLILRLIAAQGILLLAARIVLRILIATGLLAPDWDAHLRLLRIQANIADLCVLSDIVVFIGLAIAEPRARRRTIVLLVVLALALLAAGLIRA